MREFSELISEIVNSRKLEANAELLDLISTDYDYKIRKERYDIINAKQAKFYNKEIGRYDLISISDPIYLVEKEIEYLEEILTDTLREFVGKITNKDKVLVVGLGNRHISSDSLGTNVVKGVTINIDDKSSPSVMAICPSVLGLTGIETYDIVSGVVRNVKPTHLIIIDSLCASSIDRLCKSIQITNTGLCPGSGIGNTRKHIGRNLVKNVISIGVPMLIYASTFISETFHKNNIDADTISNIMQISRKQREKGELCRFIKSVDNIYSASIDNIIVSTKDIEEEVKILAGIISQSINKSISLN